ncbi:hypothetical protein GSI_11975 [Ganoderma sinense ZZ0214-1]|uniref:Beta-lactamase-related domain-containing protein n=1 Tax=Ganoderma sinense ZZ0214-1 TaxID=1077348 RepID=A0A2G8RXI4_9APHY|nr:hypothetical protein GSI_11975 [Ganoderma sinense ZZ0214-1]
MRQTFVHVGVLGTFLASVVVASATQEIFKFDAPGFRLSNAIVSPEWHAYIEQLRQNDSLPGISVGVVRLGEDKKPEVQLASWGRRTEEGDGHNMTSDTLFGIASCFKAFLSTSVGLLMDDYPQGRNVTPLPEGLKHFDEGQRHPPQGTELESKTYWRRRLKPRLGPSTPVPTQQPAEVTPPSLDWIAYTGLYKSDDGYLPVTLCSSQSDSTHCRAVVSDFATLDSAIAVATSLYSTYPAVWASHLRLQHFSGDVFNFTFTALFPHGYGQNTSAFEQFESGVTSGWVEFQVDAAKGAVEGFSLVRDLNVCAARARKTGGALSETADAWFGKV